MMPRPKRVRSSSFSTGTAGFSKKKKSPIAKMAYAKAGEIKAVDTLSAASAINTTPVFILCNGLQSGVGENNRIGRKVSMKSLHLTGYIYQNQAGAAPSNEYMRVMVVYDRQANGAVFGISDLLQSQDQAASTASTVLDHRNMSNTDRFVVLRDLRYKAAAPDGAVIGQKFQISSADGQKWVINEFINLKGLIAHYNTANNGTVVDIQTGSLYIVTFGLLSVANSQYALVSTTRLRYGDA